MLIRFKIVCVFISITFTSMVPRSVVTKPNDLSSNSFVSSLMCTRSATREQIVKHVTYYAIVNCKLLITTDIMLLVSYN